MQCLPDLSGWREVAYLNFLTEIGTLPSDLSHDEFDVAYPPPPQTNRHL